jgi:hypothetical protein
MNYAAATGGDKIRVSEEAIALVEIARDTELRINRALLPRGVIEPVLAPSCGVKN